ncbi:hypothetical protein BH10PSE18_BH10PSE18_49530 [soil metagenome]
MEPVAFPKIHIGHFIHRTMGESSVKLWVAAGAAMVVSLVHAQAPAQASPQASAQASTQAKWFTVAGNPNDAAADTVQVDPVAIGVDGPLKTMNLRVSRSALRTNWEGVPYRSYESEVAFDCRARRADYRVVTYYMAATWQGAPHVTTNYANDPKPMLFRDMSPNPTSRIIRAACRLRSS